MATSDYKIIFTGPVGAGKTTAITSISDTDPIKTDTNATDMTQYKKSQTTVAMDYGILKLDGGEQIHLYGTPGQERFDFMWDILTEGGIGLVLLVDNSSETPLNDMKFFLNAFKKFILETNVVIGITQMDKKNAPSLKITSAELRKLSLNPPVFEVDAREKKDVSLLIQALLFTLDPSIK
ncbi:MAG: ATP/GTP-binding protein [Gammaproteobacteria bacterium]|nr:ATP/GTP-binding protein [Gammaproteobacteria bacterium]